MPTHAHRRVNGRTHFLTPVAAGANLPNDCLRTDGALVRLLLEQRNEDGLLIWKIVIERGDINAGSLCDPIGCDGANSAIFEQLGRCLEDRIEGDASSRQQRRAP